MAKEVIIQDKDSNEINLIINNEHVFWNETTITVDPIKTLNNYY